MTARLFTASWSALHQASLRGPLPVTPVRISLGAPKSWPAAKHFAACDELMIARWMMHSADHSRSERAYRHQLHQITLPRIAARLDAIAAEHDDLPLALCCFEADVADCHRSWAATWLCEQTGVVVPELGSLTARRAGGEQPAFVLCYEPDEAVSDIGRGIVRQ
jgi:Domain of unknown function DUF488